MGGDSFLKVLGQYKRSPKRHVHSMNAREICQCKVIRLYSVCKISGKKLIGKC